MGCCHFKEEDDKNLFLNKPWPNCYAGANQNDTDFFKKYEMISFYNIQYKDVPHTGGRLKSNNEVIGQTIKDRTTWLSGVKVTFTPNIPSPPSDSPGPQYIVLLVTDDLKGENYRIAGWEAVHNQIWPNEEFKIVPGRYSLKPRKDYVVIKGGCYLTTKAELNTLALIPVLAKPDWQPEKDTKNSKKTLVSSQLQTNIKKYFQYF